MPPGRRPGRGGPAGARRARARARRGPGGGRGRPARSPPRRRRGPPARGPRNGILVGQAAQRHDLLDPRRERQRRLLRDDREPPRDRRPVERGDRLAVEERPRPLRGRRSPARTRSRRRLAGAVGPDERDPLAGAIARSTPRRRPLTVRDDDVLEHGRLRDVRRQARRSSAGASRHSSYPPRAGAAGRGRTAPR